MSLATWYQKLSRLLPKKYIRSAILMILKSFHHIHSELALAFFFTIGKCRHLLSKKASLAWKHLGRLSP